jgi:hypothetical protein
VQFPILCLRHTFAHPGYVHTTQTLSVPRKRSRNSASTAVLDFRRVRSVRFLSDLGLDGTAICGAVI